MLAVTLKASGRVSDPAAYVLALRALFTKRRDDLPGEVQALGSIWRALDLLRASWELQFHAGVSACVEYLEAVPWSEAEQRGMMEQVQGMGLDRTEVEALAGRLPKGPTPETQAVDGSEAASTLRDPHSHSASHLHSSSTSGNHRHRPSLSLLLLVAGAGSRPFPPSSSFAPGPRSSATDGRSRRRGSGRVV